MRTCRWASLSVLACTVLGCGGRGATAGADGGAVVAFPLVVSAMTRSPRTTGWAVNYADWTPASGDDVAGTEDRVRALAPAYLRVGGHAADVSAPDAFDMTALDQAIAYARAVGAEPIVQVPLLRDASGQPPTAATAAALVTYLNRTRAYGVKYFSIGDEPDLYASQGAPDDPAKGALPNFGPGDYCRAARDDVAAMKAVDPGVQIIGPELASQYRPPQADWLSPILQGCGDVFDVISVHRVPFAAGGGTLDQTASDPASFAGAVASIRQILQLGGFGQKPLAVTETNVASEPAPGGTIPAAAPGTVPAALWWADVLGYSSELELWTVALSATSDSDAASLGLIGPPPDRALRPAYDAYQLYADHFGPTLLAVTAAPPGLSAHASRNAADDATETVVVNWNVSSLPVAVEVTGAASPPPPAVFVLPPLSMSAITVPDHGAPAAWTYADAEHVRGAGTEPLAPSGYAAILDAGVPDAADAEAGPPPPCAAVAPPAPAITVLGGSNAGALVFGPDSYQWGSFTYAGTGEPSPTAALTPDGDGVHITAQLLPATPDVNYSGFGVYFSSTSCLDASAFRGVQFDFAGDLGGCALSVGVQSAEDLGEDSDPLRGACSPVAGACYGPSASISPASGTTVQVPFTALTGGMPVTALDPRDIVSLHWQLAAPASTPDGGPCSADFTVEDVALY